MIISNFRDISKYNPKIKKGLVFRSSALSLIDEEKIIYEILEKNNIKTIIDLRANRELEQNDYSESLKSKFNIFHSPLDPWNQPEWFKEKYQYGTNEEIAYRFFAIACKNQIKKALEAIINEENATLVHCFAGKDRTGILITLLHLLSGASENEIFADYLASEMDTKKEYLQILLDIVEQSGGIYKYLQTCNLTENQIERLKIKLFK